MSIFIPKNSLNEKLVSALNSSIEAQNRKRSSYVLLKRFAGIGIFVMLFGIAGGIACYGYARFNGVLSTEEILTKSFIEALQNVKLQSVATGTVVAKSEPLKFIKDQYLKLEQNSTVKLSPESSIKVDSEVIVAMPFDYLGNKNNNQQQKNNLQPPTNSFVVFKTLEYNKGKIYTGWKYSSSTQSKPESQFCYYTEASSFNEINADYFFAENGRLMNNLKPPENFDTNDAMQFCIWFKG